MAPSKFESKRTIHQLTAHIIQSITKFHKMAPKLIWHSEKPERSHLPQTFYIRFITKVPGTKPRSYVSQIKARPGADSHMMILKITTDLQSTFKPPFFPQQRFTNHCI